jgi:Holliday junction resolvase RusA-like endonuclease
VGCRVSDYHFTGWNYEPLVRQGPPQAVLFTVDGEPMVKARPRVTRAGHTYTPKTTVDAERRVRDAFEATGCDGFSNAVGVELAFYQGTRARKDIDNMVKLVLDSLNGVAWTDDVQVSVVLARRVYTVKERARTVVRIFATIDGVDS